MEVLGGFAIQNTRSQMETTQLDATWGFIVPILKMFTLMTTVAASIPTNIFVSLAQTVCVQLESTTKDVVMDLIGTALGHACRATFPSGNMLAVRGDTQLVP